MCDSLTRPNAVTLSKSEGSLCALSEMLRQAQHDVERRGWQCAVTLDGHALLPEQRPLHR